jgi:hypothetical protein
MPSPEPGHDPACLERIRLLRSYGCQPPPGELSQAEYLRYLRARAIRLRRLEQEFAWLERRLIWEERLDAAARAMSAVVLASVEGLGHLPAAIRGLARVLQATAEAEPDLRLEPIVQTDPGTAENARAELVRFGEIISKFLPFEARNRYFKPWFYEEQIDFHCQIINYKGFDRNAFVMRRLWWGKLRVAFAGADCLRGAVRDWFREIMRRS